MDASGLYVYVRRVRMWVAQVFEWAIEQGYASTNPAAQIRPEKAFSRRKVKHFPALDLHQMPAFTWNGSTATGHLTVAIMSDILRTGVWCTMLLE